MRVAGGMKGDWQNAASFKGFVLEALFTSVVITETGRFNMLIDGTVMVGGERVRASGDLALTPGERLPSDLEAEISIEGAGMALKAALWVNGKKLGGAGGFASTEGVKVNGKISPFKRSPFDLKDATLDIHSGPAIDLKFAVSGALALFKGYEQKYQLDLEPEKFRFSSDTKFGGA